MINRDYIREKAKELVKTLSIADFKETSEYRSMEAHLEFFLLEVARAVREEDASMAERNSKWIALEIRSRLAELDSEDGK